MIITCMQVKVNEIILYNMHAIVWKREYDKLKERIFRYFISKHLFSQPSECYSLGIHLGARG